ncbi:CHAD domain-containing protein [Lichenicola cladoniae]|uniref:CHAD domain-containing protein n=1 Tax=Lichenicola cladoniae TaxID=1484109 RepID=A0A6M8HSM0_9PROT|nr:CHAD domain-containing protein [Lichenicola cladoniae]NPD65435.1 CHAD domain-containing protein [Acetobacteraceae bacterium]QKE91494.1 CHAD domain-containing protein [Lichenicola cladoniae]
MPDELPALVQGSQTLRLQTSPDFLTSLQQAPIILNHTRNAGVVRRIDSTYYDTSENMLFENGISLSVQKRGKNFVQRLLKQEPRQSLARPATLEVSIDTGTPDIVRFANDKITWLSPTLADSLPDLTLLPRFATRIRRRIRRLEFSGAVVDLLLDDGIIIAGDRREPLTELQLVLQSGDEGVLYEIGMRLLETVPLRIATTEIVTRGYFLASDTVPAAEKAAASAVTPGSTVDELIACVFGAAQAHLHANQMVAFDGRSVDGVHQMRVALRRIRSVLSMLKQVLPSATMINLAREAKWAADELGQARAWDVFLTTTLDGPLRLTGGHADFDGLRRVAEAPRLEAYAAARAMISSDRYGRFQMSLCQWVARRGWRNDADSDGLGTLAQPAPILAARILTRLHGKALKQGRRFRALSSDERHDLRITLKKLRYASEFFHPLFDTAMQSRRHAQCLSRLQDRLGLDQDAATTQPLLDDLAARTRSPDVHRALGAVAGWLAFQSTANGGRLAKQWRHYRTMQRYWS